MLEEALYTTLKNDADISAKVKDGSVYHIYPLRFPEGLTLTNGYALTYTEISQELNYPLVRQSIFQINAFGDTFEKARNLADDVFDALNDLSEMLLGGTYPINYIKFRNRQALFDATAKLWYYSVDVAIKY
jgi:hypothetical protein